LRRGGAPAETIAHGNSDGVRADVVLVWRPGKVARVVDVGVVDPAGKGVNNRVGRIGKTGDNHTKGNARANADGRARRERADSRGACRKRKRRCERKCDK